MFRALGGKRVPPHRAQHLLPAARTTHHPLAVVLRPRPPLVVAFVVAAARVYVRVPHLARLVPPLHTARRPFVYHAYLHVVSVVPRRLMGRIWVRNLNNGVVQPLGKLVRVKQLLSTVVVVPPLGVLPQGARKKKVVQQGTVLRPLVVVPLRLLPPPPP